MAFAFAYEIAHSTVRLRPVDAAHPRGAEPASTAASGGSARDAGANGEAPAAAAGRRTSRHSHRASDSETSKGGRRTPSKAGGTASALAADDTGELRISVADGARPGDVPMRHETSYRCRVQTPHAVH